MHRIGICRRSFLLSGIAFAGGALLAGCGAESPKDVEVRNENPSNKAKESMDFYKNNNLKQGGVK